MMKRRVRQCFLMVALLTAFGPAWGQRTAFAAVEAVRVPAEDVEVLASGPIHEAFAEAVALNPEPGVVVTKAPPALIEEIPPGQRPEGKVQWIPGYWAWDDERNDYIWASGIWRVPPPGRQWVPGYWSPVSLGYQWISGYWGSVKPQQTEYLPKPPESVEVGPSSNAPSAEYTWIPGCWMWRYGGYAWRPGYWAAARPDWIWMPAHYVWTPRGYIFVGGYWDYRVIRRGILFAPVHFGPRVRFGLTFAFSPSFAISLNVFDDVLFVRDRYCHYYYGDYYAAKYYRRGFYPWFSPHARRTVYDPIYAHQRWRHRNDHEWETRSQKRFQERRNSKGLRRLWSYDIRRGPDRTIRPSGPVRSNVGTLLDRTRKTRASSHSPRPLIQKERRTFAQPVKNIPTRGTQSWIRETQRQNIVKKQTSKKSAPNKATLSRSSILSRLKQKLDRSKVLTARGKETKPNRNVAHLQKRNGLRPSKGQEMNAKAKGRQSATVRAQGPRQDARKSWVSKAGGLSQSRTQRSNPSRLRAEAGRARWNIR